MSDRRFRDMVNLRYDERQDLLSRLHGKAMQDSAAHCEKKTEGREDARYRYARDSLPIAVEHPGGGISTFMVCGRNLSSSGISLIHGAYLNANTHCRILLEQLDGSQITIEGAVVGCRHLQQSLHEISVKFENRIEIEAFMSAAERDSSVIPVGDSNEDSGHRSDEPSPESGQINSTLTNLHVVAAELENAIEQGAIEHIKSLCQEVSRNTSHPASESLVPSAKTILELIESAGLIEDTIAEVRKLASMCAELAPPG